MPLGDFKPLWKNVCQQSAKMDPPVTAFVTQTLLGRIRQRLPELGQSSRAAVMSPIAASERIAAPELRRSLRVYSCSATQTLTVTLTLLLTSFSFGRMSKEKPSACPLDRLPPFMKLPKASTRPSTCRTIWLLWRIWCTQTHTHTQMRQRCEVKFRKINRKRDRQVAHLAHSLKDFYFAEDGGDTLVESWLKQDAEHPLGEVGDLG